MSDGKINRAWRLQAPNLRQSEDDPVDLSTIHASFRANYRCPLCRGDLPARFANPGCNVHPGVACNYCIKHGLATKYLRRYNLTRDHGYNIVDEDVCSEEERDMVIVLGEIKVDLMNRSPDQLDVNSWK